MLLLCVWKVPIAHLPGVLVQSLLYQVCGFQQTLKPVAIGARLPPASELLEQEEQQWAGAPCLG